MDVFLFMIMKFLWKILIIGIIFWLIWGFFFLVWLLKFMENVIRSKVFVKFIVFYVCNRWVILDVLLL